ncbi:hypothetical protein D046_9198, partial [Vibrio parahaemolyticus V-223/04]
MPCSFFISVVAKKIERNAFDSELITSSPNR